MMIDFMNKLSNGEFGLAKTYWLYGVLPSFLVNTISKFLPIELSLAMIVPISIYALYIVPGIWNSANKYNGKLNWAPPIAKTCVVIDIILTIMSISGLVYLYALKTL